MEVPVQRATETLLNVYCDVELRSVIQFFNVKVKDESAAEIHHELCCAYGG